MIFPKDINRAFGNVDLYLLDQILKERFEGKKKILDAGCGEGRNIKFFLNSGFEVHGIDYLEEAIIMASLINKNATFQIASISEQPYPEQFFDAIICINVLHHCQTLEDFKDSFNSLCKMLKTQGVLFIRTLISENKKSFSTSEGFLTITHSIIEDLRENNSLKWVEPLKWEHFDQKNLSVIVLEKD